MKPLADGEADAVFGSRMLGGRGALKGGMPLYKYVGNKLLTWFQNRILRTHFTEFHSGYRVYSIAALRRIPFDLNTNVFHFDTEIIIQLLIAGQRIKEIAIPTYYGDEICHVNGLRYAWDVAVATVNACRLHEGHDPLALEDLQRNGIIEYINFPPELEGKYQSYTQADISALRSAGYAEPFLTVEEGVTRYVGQLYERRSARYQV